MSRKTRRILFVAALVAFGAIGFVVTMYARGYRWDLKTSRFLLAGAVYIKPESPDGTNILINNKDTGKHSAALIKNLLPLRKYRVVAAKDGYQNWEKEFEVEPGLVTEAKNIILFPQQLSSQTVWLDPSANDFSVSPNQKAMAVKLGSDKVVFANLQEPAATATVATFTDGRKTAEVGFAKGNRPWSGDSKKFIFWRRTATTARQNSKTVWYIWEAEKKSATNLAALYETKIILKTSSASPLPVKFAPDQISWFGQNNLLVLLDKKIIHLDVKNETVTNIKLDDIVAFDVFENKILALKNSDILMLVDSAAENINALGQTKFPAQKIAFSPNGEKAAYYNSGTIGVLWLKDTSDQPLKKANDQEIVHKANGDIRDLYWHRHGEHLIFLEDGKLTATEIDTRPPINKAAWPQNINAIDYLADNSKLYLLLPHGAIELATDKF